MLLALRMALKIIHSVSILQSRVLEQQNQPVYPRLAFTLLPIRVYSSVFMDLFRLILFLVLLSTVVQSQLRKRSPLHQPRAQVEFILFHDEVENIAAWASRVRKILETDVDMMGLVMCCLFL